MKKKLVIMGFLIVSLTLSGCDNKDKGSDIKEKVEEVENTQVEEEVTEEALPETVEYTISNEKGDSKIKVSATVEAETLNGLAVLNVKPKEFTGEYVENIAKKFFDNGEYEVYKSLFACNQEELEEHKVYYQQLMEENEGVDFYTLFYHASGIDTRVPPSSQIVAIEMYQEGYEDLSDLYETDGILYSMTYEYYTATSVPIRGDYGGEPWTMGAVSLQGNNYCNSEVRAINIQPAYSKTCILDYVGLDDMNSSLYGGANRLDIEMAKEEANEIVAKLGFEDMEVLHTVQACVESSENSIGVLDGYCFIYGKDMGELGAKYWNGGLTVIGELGIDEGAPQPYVYVTVTSSGIENISIGMEYEVIEELSDNTDILSFEQVDAIAQKHFQELVNEHKCSQDISSIELGYVYVRYDTENYAVVPAWIYYEGQDGYDGKTYAFRAFNAIDGSVIETYTNYGHNNVEGL